MSSEKPISEPETSSRPLALGVAVVAGLLAVVLRVVPHPPNFSGIGGLGIFGGARLRGWQAYVLPLGIMILSDVSLWVLTGFNPLYSLGHLSRVYVYASFMIYVGIGRWLGDNKSHWSIALAATAGALQFFLVTNFCEWLFQPFMQVADIYRYSRDWTGLAACYLAGLGFYQQESAAVIHPFMLFKDFRLSLFWMIVADILFTTTYLLVHDKLAQRIYGSRTATAPAVHV